ncbi:hypothetical protein PI124_g24050 [Phytophthora idaei]|nr:hypothetical protein PI126_g14729 [Phytophthora idaei]KAG3230852.1 hypothetical protein PI124_g24050 [Phytophthora idaei]
MTRQWPLPRDQVKAIDDFFESRRQAGQVRESKFSHSAPTFCVKKPQGGWRIVHAYNELNDATIPAQTPIPRKDVIIDSMAKSTIYSALDLRDGFYQILMRKSDIPLTAVSTPSGILWEWIVMLQGLKNVPATFNRCVAHLLRSVRDFAPSYFDDVFVHGRTVNGKTDVEVHKLAAWSCLNSSASLFILSRSERMHICSMRPSNKSFAKRIQLMAGSDVNSDALVGGFSISIDRYWRPVRVRVKTFNVSTLDVASDVCPADIFCSVSVPDRDLRSLCCLRCRFFLWSPVPLVPRPGPALDEFPLT